MGKVMEISEQGATDLRDTYLVRAEKAERERDAANENALNELALARQAEATIKRVRALAKTYSLQTSLMRAVAGDIESALEPVKELQEENKEIRTSCPWGEWHYIIPLDSEELEQARKEENNSG